MNRFIKNLKQDLYFFWRIKVRKQKIFVYSYHMRLSFNLMNTKYDDADMVQECKKRMMYEYYDIVKKVNKWLVPFEKPEFDIWENIGDFTKTIRWVARFTPENNLKNVMIYQSKRF